MADGDSSSVPEAAEGVAQPNGLTVKEKKTFHIDTHKIQSVPKYEQNAELQDLGLQVYNQETFEQGVLAQVDEMIENEERQRLMQVLNKDLSSIDEDIRTCEQELAQIDKVISMMGNGSSSETKHRIMSVESQRRTVKSRMQTLSVRRKVTLGKLDAVLNESKVTNDLQSAAGNVNDVLGFGAPNGENSLVRCGEMTPFGSLTKNKTHCRSTLQKSPQGTRHKAPDDLQKRHKRKFSSLGDERVKKRSKSESDWEPDSDSHESESSETEVVPGKKSRKIRSQKRDEAYDSDMSSERKSSKYSKFVELPVVDDGDEEVYQARLRKLHKEEIQRQKQRALKIGDGDLESGSDMEIEDGFKVPGRVWNKLYRYQKTGVRWLWELHCQQAGGILGDEMGLGKTIQIICFLAGLHYSKLQDRSVASRYIGLGPVLIVCPATVMHQWVKEFHFWFPDIRVSILHATGSYRSSEAELVNSVARSRAVLISAYSTVLIQQDLLLSKDWHYIILDEGHKIRNPDAQITLACKQFRTCHRIILSGSPVQNNLKELWSLFDFVFPGKLGTLPDFMQHFSVPIVQGGYANATQVQVQTAYKCACVLRDTIAPYLLRRLKADVNVSLHLPNKNEQVLFCCLSHDQRQVYQEYLDSKECHMILSGNYMVFPGLITLRKICNHPDLSTGGPKIFGNVGTASSEAGDEADEYGYWKRSGKMVVIESLLKLWKKQNHKVLLFTQSRQMLDILESFVKDRGYHYLRMDGATSIGSRQQLVTQFNSDESIFVFLLTTRVGGLGINLTGADRVVIFDPDWNPSTDTQARERAWRIGQTRPVTVYRLLTTGTIEEKIYHRQIFKQFLTNRVLKDPKQRRFFKSNDLYELFTLGDDSRKAGTETSAIFAGTNSDVKLRKRQHATKGRQNRFDYLKEKEKEFGLTSDKGNDEECKDDSDDERVTKMRELARRLSQRIAENKTVSSSEPSDEPQTAEMSSGPKVVNAAETSPPCTPSLDGSIVKEVLSANKKSSTSDLVGGTTCSPTGKVKKRRKKHRTEAVVDGEKIANVERASAYQPHNDINDPADSSQHDDYVLRKLLKKNVHSAMLHDNIMQSANPDYVLVECEAERVARDAAHALRLSRQHCRVNTPLGTPTWTGQNGHNPSRLRFGTKKNTALMAAAQNGVTKKKTPPTEQKHASTKPSLQFDGSALFSTSAGSDVTLSSAGILPSTELLEQMRIRKPGCLSRTTEDASSTSSNQLSVTAVNQDPQSMELIRDIREFVACRAAVDGQATTKEITDHFQSRVPAELTAKFKAMLKQVCDYSRVNETGMWKLKPEFR